ncbi:hypothetical protein [Paenibacillus etheri]|uniref:Uncharacterized protein n=1 Tax=Paenibacillus etheri TaxID=1306852 RepID=A0A0W1B3K9_9BACL|nr:hypothetical protein [Paenibacillus etheri]KTD88158.1 hypothetical protein UQ64_06615 [Paenibacillus etheri]
MRDVHVQIFNSGMYYTKKYDLGSYWEVNQIFTREYTYDCYCPKCERGSVFTKVPEPHSIGGASIPFVDTIPSQREVCKSLTLHCSRNEHHTISFYFRLYKPSIHYIELTKVGQYPSIADLSNADTKKYSKVLGRTDNHELNKAIGLFAHGVGIGSFVYLRRIFENLIEEAHQQAIGSPEWDDSEYSSSRMNEKIALLKEYVPAFLLENRFIYSILSKGIHELSEEECKEAFPAVRIGIEFILDEKINKQEELQKRSAARQSLEELHARYK